MEGYTYYFTYEETVTHRKKYYNRISKIINDNNLRVDFHPDQFCVLNSTNKDVVKNSIDIYK